MVGCYKYCVCEQETEREKKRYEGVRVYNCKYKQSQSFANIYRVG